MTCIRKPAAQYQAARHRPSNDGPWQAAPRRHRVSKTRGTNWSNAQRGGARHSICRLVYPFAPHPTLPPTSSSALCKHEHHQTAKVRRTPPRFHACPPPSTRANMPLQPGSIPSLTRARSSACKTLSASSMSTTMATSTSPQSSRPPSSRSTSLTMSYDKP